MISNKAEKCPKCDNSVMQDDKINEVVTLSNSLTVKCKIKMWAISIAAILILTEGFEMHALGSKGNSTSSASNTTLLSVANKDNVEESDTIVRITPEFSKAISKYEKLGSFSEGMAAVMRDGKWGYINTKGNEVIPCQFPDPYDYYISGPFSEGLALIQKDGKWGFVNTKGLEVIPINIEAEAVGRFSEGLAFVYIDEENFSVIDKKGGIVFSGKSEFSWYFGSVISSELLPVYHQGNICVPLEPDNFAVFDKLGNKVREIDQNTKDVLDKQNEKKPYTIFLKENGENEDSQYFTVGLKDSNGKEIIPAIYDEIGNAGLGEKVDAPNGVVLVVLDEIGENAIKGYGDELDSPDSKRHYGYADLKGHDTFTDNVKLLCKKSKMNSTDTGDNEEQNYVQTTSSNNQSFNSWGDFCNYFRTAKKYQGRSAYFNGIIEIKTNDSEISVYVGGKYLSQLGFARQDQQFLFGDYARMAVYVEGRTYPVVVHLPDSQHPYGYFYFEPIATSTNRNLAAVLNLPVEEGWMWVEPQIENGKGTLIWHTDSKTKPTPIIYKLIE